MKKQTKTTPSVVLTSAAAVGSGFTVGLDLGDRSHYVSVLDATGQILYAGPMLNDRVALALLLTNYPAATVALEAGTHSPWISRYLTGRGATVIVANPRKLPAISRHERKCDSRDAVRLARLARAENALLHPLTHDTAPAQHDLLGLKLRDAFVRTRVNRINTVRFTLKSLGHAVSNPASEAFHKSILTAVPADCLPVLAVLTPLTEQIKTLERDLVARRKKDYPVPQRLQQIAGVGPLTALCFVLKIGEPARFGHSRAVGPYLGLCPGRDQSGGTDKQLRRRAAAPIVGERRGLHSRAVRPGLCAARLRAAPRRHQCPRKETRGGGGGAQAGGTAAQPVETRRGLRTARVRRRPVDLGGGLNPKNQNHF